jgi:hypothetical protein
VEVPPKRQLIGAIVQEDFVRNLEKKRKSLL